MQQNLTMIIVTGVASLFVYCIFNIRAKNKQIASANYKYDKMVIQLSTLSTSNKYLLRKVEGMRTELDEIHHTEEES